MISESPAALTAKRLASLVRHRELELFSLTGTTGGEPLRVLVADDGATLSYVKALAFEDEPDVKRVGKSGAFAAPGLAGAGADVVVVGANCMLSGLYARNGFTLVPKWVRLFLPTTEETYPRLYNFGRQTRKYFKWMLKKVKEEGFECDIVSDPSWLRVFYDDMYTPYAKSRFGELAVVHSLSEVRRKFSSGFGVVVGKGGEPVAGAVISRRGRVISIPHFGVVESNLDAYRAGGNFALDYFVVEWAHSSGIERVDFGHSRAFLTDGVLRYKLNWHMDVVDDDDAIGVFAIATPGRTPSARRFLARNRFYELTPDGPRLTGGSVEEEEGGREPA
ncbi:MAG: GNAT family N-acetyltransferase [Armatimonadota bacterium]|nr:GNAT family N-acetyltransferase [Armatimonadota bacterium]